MKKDLNFWLGVLAFFLLYTFLLSWMQKSDEEAKEAEAFGNGIAQGIAMEVKLNKARSASNALEWWVGSDEIGAVRERLCRNYYPKVK